MESASDHTVLIVDDEREIRHTYRSILSEWYTVRTAATGADALDQLDGSVDAVLLDRQLPDMTGGEVLDRIRDADCDCRVAMVSGVDPDFDILDMGFDDYLVKPVTSADLRNAVDSLIYWDEYDSIVQEYLTKAAKVATLEAEKSPAELESHERYGELKGDLDELSVEAESIMQETIEAGEFETLMREL